MYERSYRNLDQLSESVFSGATSDERKAKREALVARRKANSDANFEEFANQPQYKVADWFVKIDEVSRQRKENSQAPTTDVLHEFDTDGNRVSAAPLSFGEATDAYTAKMTRAESGGRADAKNPNSSATGVHQFVSGTWMGLVNKHKPSWAEGKSKEEILAMRKDPAASTEMLQHFRLNNQAVLKKAGVPITDATEYGAHFLGAGTAAKLFTVDPSLPVSAVATQAQIKANGSILQGKTVGEVRNWLNRKMA